MAEIQTLGEFEGLLRDRIAADGPMRVSEFMTTALYHPRLGYYAGRDPLGKRGDFTTAPEISQMFGELIGLWCVVVWRSMGAPDPVILAELGPGRGTMMMDALRAAALDPAFRRALRPHLVETSDALRALQERRLAGAGACWHADFNDLPRGPMILLANEFFDALPIRQFVRIAGKWRERLVGLADDALAFVAGPEAAIDGPEADENAIFEAGEIGVGIAAALGARLAKSGGAALIVDYGYAEPGLGETLQAISRHAYAGVLAAPGEADLSAHVDFAALARAAAPARSWGVVGQGDFLQALGIEARSERIIQAHPGRAAEIAAACRRLIDRREMGTLFKVMALTHPALPPPPGFA